MNKNYYSFEELDSIELQLIEMLGVKIVYSQLVKWLGYEKLEAFLRDICCDCAIEIDGEVNDDSNN